MQNYLKNFQILHLTSQTRQSESYFQVTTLLTGNLTGAAIEAIARLHTIIALDLRD